MAVAVKPRPTDDVGGVVGAVTDVIAVDVVAPWPASSALVGRLPLAGFVDAAIGPDDAAAAFALAVALPLAAALPTDATEEGRLAAASATEGPSCASVGRASVAPTFGRTASTAAVAEATTSPTTPSAVSRRLR